MSNANENFQKLSAKPSWLTNLTLILLGICSLSKCEFTWRNYEDLYKQTEDGELMEYQIHPREIEVEENVQLTEPPSFLYKMSYTPETNITLVRKMGPLVNEVEIADGILYARANVKQTFFEYLSNEQLPTSDPLLFMQKVSEVSQIKDSDLNVGPNLTKYNEMMMSPGELHLQIMNNQKLLNIIYNDKRNRRAPKPDHSFFTFGSKITQPSFNEISNDWATETSQTLQNEFQKEMVRRVELLQKNYPKKKEGSGSFTLFSSGPDSVTNDAIKKIIKEEMGTFEKGKAMFNEIKSSENILLEALNVNLFNMYVRNILQESEVNLLLQIAEQKMNDPAYQTLILKGDWSNSKKTKSGEIHMNYEIYDNIVRMLSGKINEYIFEQFKDNKSFSNAINSLNTNINGSIATLFERIRSAIEEYWSGEEIDFINAEEELYKEKWSFIPYVVAKYVEANKKQIEEFLDDFFNYCKDRSMANSLYLPTSDKFDIKMLRKTLSYINLDYVDQQDAIRINLFKAENRIAI